MGYSRENLANVRKEIDRRRSSALRIAEERQRELDALFPDIKRIDEELAMTGLLVMEEISKGRENIEKRINDIRLDNETLVRQRRELLEGYGYPADYSDIRYTCPKCADTGFDGTDMCVCMKTLLVKEGLKSAGLDKLFETQSFDTFSLSYYSFDERVYNLMKQYLSICRDYAESFNEKTVENLLFCGGTGLGKTHMSTAIAGRVIEKGYDVCYNSAQNIFNEYEAERFGRGNADMPIDTGKYLSCDLLIMDDLGAESANQFTVSVLYNIINTRVVAGRPMIINTNLTHEEVRRKYSDRIASRIFGEFTALQFQGKDIRFLKL